MKDSYSIKYMLPALVPELSYNNAEIKEGGKASNILFQWLIKHLGVMLMKPRRELLKYCKLDTYAMVIILK